MEERYNDFQALRGAVLTGVLVAFSAPIVANAADAPTTKADCKKAKDIE